MLNNNSCLTVKRGGILVPVNAGDQYLLTVNDNTFIVYFHRTSGSKSYETRLKRQIFSLCYRVNVRSHFIVIIVPMYIEPKRIQKHPHKNTPA